MQSTSYPARLGAACRAKRSAVCVGIDPRFEMLPSEFTAGCGDSHQARADAIAAWATELLDVIAPHAPIVKPQSAFFEVYGGAGFGALSRTITAARERGLIVLLDAKRGDIGSTAEAYARALLDDGGMGADAVTVNAYLGRDTLEPFLERCRAAGKGIYVLVKTSNPGSADLQGQPVGPAGAPLHEHVSALVRELGASTPTDEHGWTSVGAVVGATYPAELEQLRERMPHTPLLVPGYGAQGGGAEDCRGAFGDDGLGAVVNSSRGITYAFRKGEHAERYGDARWRESVVAAVTEMREALAAVAGVAEIP
jgi:orotidine-5'-phosphate decarboxylase